MRLLLILFISALALWPMHAPAQNLEEIDPFFSDQDDQSRGFYDLFSLTTKERSDYLDAKRDGIEFKLSVDMLSKRYVENCLTQKPENPSKDEKIREFLCFCSAASMNAVMEPDEIRSMFIGGETGKANQQRMLVLGVGPCLKKPAAHLLYRTCIKDLDPRQKNVNPAQTCQCAVRDLAGYALDNLFERYFSKNLALEDYLKALTTNVFIKRRHLAKKRTCIVLDEFN